MIGGGQDRRRAAAAGQLEVAPVVPIPTPRRGPARRPGLPAPAPITPAGFHAELEEVSLWDLVQMESLNRNRHVVQVTGEGGVGYLYFSAGRVVHAVTPRLSGLEAALEILGWTNGAFQPCERTWPTTATIETSQEALILLAAKRQDEAAASNLVAFRGRSASDASPQGRGTDEAYEVEVQEIEEGSMSEIRRSSTNHPGAPVSITRDEPLPDFSVMIRVGANGAIVKNKGGTEELAGVVAYTQRLVELVGEIMGLEPFQAMECTFKERPGAASGAQTRCLLFTEANGDVVALRPRAESNIQPLRESLGL